MTTAGRRLWRPAIAAAAGIMVLAGSAATAGAATFDWSIHGTTLLPPVGGSGSWDLASANWGRLDHVGIPPGEHWVYQRWDNDGGHIARFGGVPGTVEALGASAGGLIFNSSYTLTGVLFLGSADSPPTVHTASGVTATIDASLFQRGGPLRFTGPGVTRLGSSFTHFSPGIEVQNGTLVMETALDRTLADVTLNDGAIRFLGGDWNLRSFGGDGGTLDFGGHNVTVHNATDRTFAGRLSGATNTFTFNGSSTLTLTGQDNTLAHYDQVQGHTRLEGGSLTHGGVSNSRFLSVRSGTFTLADGATLLADAGNVGVASRLTITGANTTARVSELNLGASASAATLQIADSGRFVTTNLVLNSGKSHITVTSGGSLQTGGVTLDEDDSAIVTGAGSQWNAGDLDLNDGSLRVEDGAAVAFNRSTASGEIAVIGVDAILHTGHLAIRADRDTDITIGDGGAVVSDETSLGIGPSGAGRTSVTVTGAGSTWTTGNLTVSNTQEATVVVENGGSLLTLGDSATIGTGTGRGTVILHGAGTTWNASGRINIADPLLGSREGGLAIHEGAAVHAADDVAIHSGGVLFLNGGLLRAKNLLPRGGRFGWTSGTIELTAGQVDYGVDEANGQAFTVRDNTTLRITNRLYAAPTAELTVDPGGTLEANEAITAGKLTLTQGVARVQEAWVNYGEIRARDATIEVSSFINDPMGRLLLEGENTIRAASTGPRTRFDNLGEMEVADATVFEIPVGALGRVSGPGTIVLLESYSPGPLRGIDHIEGALRFGAQNTAIFELAGLAPGSQHDKVVAGMLFLGGTLQLQLIGYAPQAGDLFDLFDAEEVGGGFDTILAPTLGHGLAWDFSQLHTTGVVRVIPEPTTLALLAAAIAWPRRR